MAKRKPMPSLEGPFTRELRSAVADHLKAESKALHALAMEAGLDDAVLRRFMSRERSLTLDSADRLASALGLAVIRKARRPARLETPVEG
jgi:hypothetical protein